MNLRISLQLDLLLVLTKGFSQETYFFNSGQNLILMNPSFAGSNGFVRNQTSFQGQVTSFPGRPYDFASSTDVYIKEFKAGVSVTGMQQGIGPLKTIGASLGYAQHISLNKDLKIIPSLQFSGYQKTISNIWITPGGFAAGRYKKDILDLNSGILVNYKGFYGGVSAFHLVDLSKHGEQGLDLRTYNLHASYNLNAGDHVKINVSVLNQNSYAASHTQLALNALLFNHFLVGGGWQHMDSGYLSFGYRENYFNIQMFYSPQVSRPLGYSVSTLQGSASFNLSNKEKRKLVTSFEEW